MTRVHIPAEILSAAHARSQARVAREWAEADRLRAVIEDAGWRVVDRGVDFRLEPAIPPGLEAEGTLIHGSSATVLSRLGEPPDLAATVVVLPTAGDPFATLLASARSAMPADTHMVAVTGEALGTDTPDDAEVVRMLDSVALGDRLNAGVRRSRGRVVAVLSARCAGRADILDTLIHGLDDVNVAVVGMSGSRTSDLRTFTPNDAEADVIGLECMAFRREDAIAIGPVDARFVDELQLAAWLSLALRYGSGAPDLEDPPTPRSARVVAPPEPGCEPPTADAARPDATASRAARRDYYRVRDAFGPLLARNIGNGETRA